MSSESSNIILSTDLTVETTLELGWELCTTKTNSAWFLRVGLDDEYEYLTTTAETVTISAGDSLSQRVRFDSATVAKEAAEKHAYGSEAAGPRAGASEDHDEDDASSGHQNRDSTDETSFVYGNEDEPREDGPGEDKPNEDKSTKSEPREDEPSEDEPNEDKSTTDEPLETESIKQGTDSSMRETIQKFFAVEENKIDDSRPDARNVQLDFTQGSLQDNIGGITWSEEIDTFQSKLNDARSDQSVRGDIMVDLRRRYFGLLKSNKYAAGDAFDSVISLLLTGLGVLIFAAGFAQLLASAATGGGISGTLITPSGYGAAYALLSVAIATGTGLFWISRRADSEYGYGITLTARGLITALLVGQIGIAALLFAGLVRGSPFQLVYEVVRLPLNQFTTVWVPQNAPGVVYTALQAFGEQPLPVVGQSMLTLLQSTVSLFIGGGLMALVGGLSAYPVVKRSVARFVLTANLQPREFREETGILESDLVDEEDKSNDTKHDFGVPDAADIQLQTDAVSEDERDRRLSREETEALMALPDTMRQSPFEGYEEVRRYWVRAPYSYVSIVYSEAQNDYRYVAVEPELDESERVVFDEIREILDTMLLFEDIEDKEDAQAEQRLKRDRLERQMVELADKYNIDVEDETFHRLTYYIIRDYVNYNKIDPLMNDPNVEDISCDGEGAQIFVFHRDYKDVITNISFERAKLRSFIQELAQRSGEHISAADPMIDASLPDGSRAQMTLGSEVTTKGSTFTIRLFKEIPFTPVDLLGYNTFSLNQMAYLWTSIQHNKSLIFAGGTASGKTTSMNAVSMFIPPKAKVITIEDTREISLPQENWIPGTTRDSLGDDGDEINMYALLRAALRQRPEYLVVGEIRGSEAETLFQAMNTGHTTYSTMHAETVSAAIGRLTNPPINVPKQMITALDIVCIQNQIRMTDEDGSVNNVRRNEEMREIVGLRDNGEFENRRPYQWDPETDTFIESLEESDVLARIQEENGWTSDELREDLKERREVLSHMVENEITDFEMVSKVIQGYMIDSDKIVGLVRDGNLDPDELDDISEMNWKAPEQSLNELTEEGAAADMNTDAEVSGD